MARGLKYLYIFLFLMNFSSALRAAVLNYTIPESLRSAKDYGPLLSFRIADNSSDRGALLTADGASIQGTYSFAKFTGDSALSDAQFLRVSRDQHPRYSYLFLSNAARSSLMYLGWSEDSSLQNADIQTNHSAWRAVAFFLKAPSNQMTLKGLIDATLPLKLNSHPTMPTDMKAFFAQSSGVPREVYFSVYMNRLLDILIAQPSLTINQDLIYGPSVNVVASSYPVVSANRRYTLAQRVASNWSKFSMINKINLVYLLSNGDGRIQDLFAGLVSSILNTPRIPEFEYLDPVVRSIAINPDVNATKRSELLTIFANSYINDAPGHRNTHKLQLFREILDDADGVALNKGDFIALQDQMASVAISFNVANPTIARGSIAAAYLAENFRSRVPSTAQFLIDYDNDRAMQRSSILTADFNQLSWQEINTMLTDPTLLNTNSLISYAVDKTMKKVSANFNQKLADPNNVLPIDNAVLNAIRLMKKTNTYEDQKWITPILRLYNPQQAGESSSQYSTRFAHVYGLWSNYKIFLFDIYGGMYSGGMKLGSAQTYTQVFQDFGLANPMLLDIAYLRTSGNVTGISGMICMNWFATETPANFARTIFHEGAHAIDTAFKAKNKWKVLQPYYFEKDFSEPNAAVVSSYSLFNIFENHAELFAAMAWDGAFWLREAINRYTLGDKRLLNQFINITLPSGRLRLLKILANGKASPSILPGSWLLEPNGLSGSMQTGTYQFTFDSKTIRLKFFRSQITQMTIF